MFTRHRRSSRSTSTILSHSTAVPRNNSMPRYLSIKRCWIMRDLGKSRRKNRSKRFYASERLHRHHSARGNSPVCMSSMIPSRWICKVISMQSSLSLRLSWVSKFIHGPSKAHRAEQSSSKIQRKIIETPVAPPWSSRTPAIYWHRLRRLTPFIKKLSSCCRWKSLIRLPSFTSERFTWFFSLRPRMNCFKRWNSSQDFCQHRRNDFLSRKSTSP